MDIKEIAERIRIEVLDQYGMKHRYTQEEAMMKQAQEALVAELAKGNEPKHYLWQHKYGDATQMLSSNSGPHPDYEVTPLYTLPPTASHIEQETAEACAAFIRSNGIGFADDDEELNRIAEAIRSGAWKEFKK